MLKIGDNLTYNKPYQLTTTFQEEMLLTFHLKKVHGKDEKNDQYHINLSAFINGKKVNLGYIYFFMNEDLKESHFIGMMVNDKYRNHGLGTKLIAAWLKLCWDNDYFNLSTNQKQRKPFLLHILKKFGFEIRDTNYYQKSSATIYICASPEKDKKYILFKSGLAKEGFMKQRIYLKDNYEIIDNADSEHPVIDRVIPMHSYLMTDSNMALNKAQKIYNNFK